MDKILQSVGSRDGGISVTNDGATILRAIHVDNAAAKVLVNIAKTQASFVSYHEENRNIKPSFPPPSQKGQLRARIRVRFTATLKSSWFRPHTTFKKIQESYLLQCSEYWVQKCAPARILVIVQTNLRRASNRRIRLTQLRSRGEGFGWLRSFHKLDRLFQSHLLLFATVRTFLSGFVWEKKNGDALANQRCFPYRATMISC